MTTSSRAEEETPEKHAKAAKTIHKEILERTEDVDLSEHDQVHMEMAITEICGLSGIHRQTWYDTGVAYKLQKEYDSFEYREREGVFIDVKQFLNEYSD
jgi:hypothetical protein